MRFIERVKILKMLTKTQLKQKWNNFETLGLVNYITFVSKS